MTKIPSDDILEGLFKLGIRESEKLKTELELCNMEIHQKKAGLDGQGDGAPKAGQEQAAAGSRGSRTCVCAITFSGLVWHAQGGKDELTSCRGTV